MLIRPVTGQFQRHADLGLWGVHDYRHGFARFRDGFRESGQGLTFWDTFLAEIVTLICTPAFGFTVWDTFLRDFMSRFVNYPIIVGLGHEFRRFRVPFRE